MCHESPSWKLKNEGEFFLHASRGRIGATPLFALPSAWQGGIGTEPPFSKSWIRHCKGCLNLILSICPLVVDAQLYLYHTCSYVLTLPHCSSPPYSHHTTGYRCHHLVVTVHYHYIICSFNPSLWISRFFKVSYLKLKVIRDSLSDSIPQFLLDSLNVSWIL